MQVHVFENSPSPAVVIYGLWRAAQEGEQRYGSESRQFVKRHFYVDDHLPPNWSRGHWSAQAHSNNQVVVLPKPNQVVVLPKPNKVVVLPKPNKVAVLPKPNKVVGLPKSDGINLWRSMLIVWRCATQWSMYGKHCTTHVPPPTCTL